MKLEKLKEKNYQKVILGGLITISILSVLIYKTTSAKYRTTQSIDIAKGTINYKMPDLNMVAMYQTNSVGTGYDAISTVPTSGYALNTANSYCGQTNSSGTFTKDSSVSLEYKDGKINISNFTKRGTKCYLYFDKLLTSSSIIASLEVKSVTPDFSVIATKEESKENNGIYQVEDEMYGGTSYYWRGAATTNHVIFAEKCWRIIRINGDKTLRLIYNGGVQEENTCVGNGANADSVIMGATDAEKYFATSDGKFNNSSYVGWTYTLSSQRPTTDVKDSNAKVQTDKWYQTNITDKGYDGKVVTGKYCVDRNTGEKYSKWWTDGPYTTEWSAAGTRFAYATANRVYNLHEPTLSCPDGDIYNLKAGTITADEIELVGGKEEENNVSYYLYNGQNYWSMSPCGWSGGGAHVFYVNVNGRLNDHGVNSTFGLRPVINLKADTVFKTGGTGTTENPYVVK